jgi:hypothetical protein
LTGISHDDTFRVQGDDKKKLVRDTVFIKLIPHVVVARTYAIIDLVNVFRTHGTNFDSGFGFYVLDRFIAFSLSESVFDKPSPDSEAFSWTEALLNDVCIFRFLPDILFCTDLLLV